MQKLTSIAGEAPKTELFGDEEAPMSSGTSLSLEISIPNPMTPKPSLQAGNDTQFEDHILGADSNDDSQLGNDNSPDINLEGIDWISLGSEHLFANDDALGAVITKHQILPLCDTEKMTNFQRVTRQLMELISVPQKKATIYEALENLCHPDVVRPHSVRTISDQQLVDIGVASTSQTMILLDLSKKYAEAGEDEMPILLSDDMLTDLSDYEIFYRLREIKGLGAYMEFTIMVFGLEKMLNSWPNEREFRLKYYRFNQQLQRSPWSDEAVVASNSWKPFKGLAAWIIWTYL